MPTPGTIRLTATDFWLLRQSGAGPRQTLPRPEGQGLWLPLIRGFNRYVERVAYWPPANIRQFVGMVNWVKKSSS